MHAGLRAWLAGLGLAATGCAAGAVPHAPATMPGPAPAATAGPAPVISAAPAPTRDEPPSTAASTRSAGPSDALLAAPPAATVAPPAAPEPAAVPPPASVPSLPSPPAGDAPAPATPAAPADLALERGRTALARGGAGAALPALREAVRLVPERLDARLSLAAALQASGDLEGAIDETRAIVRRDPDMGVARVQLGTALMARQDWPGARAELEEALRRQPDLVAAHLGLALVRYTQGDLTGAIASYRRVLDLEPAHADARYHLALALKLARREAEAARELGVAAEAGLPRAQYFLGAAYATAAGVPRDLVRAVAWWLRAAEGGVPQAEGALGQLRQAALGRTRHAPAERQAIQQAFRDYRDGIWSEFPELSRDGEDSVGAALLKAGRAEEALPVLLREAAALGEAAQRALEAVYERGVDGRVAPHDGRALAWIRAAAAEGQPGARVALARIYAGGLGVPRDVGRAVALLRATPHEEAQRLLRELAP